MQLDLSNGEIRLYDTFGSNTNLLDRVKYNWVKVDIVKTLGYTEKKDLMSKLREESRNKTSE